MPPLIPVWTFALAAAGFRRIDGPAMTPPFRSGTPPRIQGRAGCPSPPCGAVIPQSPGRRRGLWGNPFARLTALVLVLSLSSLLKGAEPLTPAVRRTTSLDGAWEFQRDGATASDWKTIAVPSSFEAHEGIEFDGVGWYRRSVPPFGLRSGRRVLLHFQAAATDATVWWNGERFGSHLGGWTPFRWDITDLVRRAPAGQPHELRVRLDEKVGHNSQGFLPIIAPHFGGIWQGVALLEVPDTYVDDLRVLAIGDLAKSEFRIELPLGGTTPTPPPEVRVRGRLRGETEWLELPAQAQLVDGRVVLSAPIASPRPWSPAEPNLYELELELGGPGGDCIRTRAAFRSVEVFGSQFRLNGRPLQLRGLLNWGFSPPSTDPNPGEDVWRQEIEFARSRGFNLMKFCLWIPPRRYLELADETGMLTWMEYPTWHPTLTREYLDPLRREFLEFFQYDRNHPSIVLRSLTCETGHGAQIEVIQDLYDLAKATIPGAVIEDDSSWIGWHRVHDFYDDHPYGNNHTWLETLDGFREHILAHGLKPLVLGEAMAADTWIDRDAILARLGTERPWWAPAPLDEIPRWEERLRAIAGPGGLDRLRADSLRYGLLMRKFQTEVYRREIPYGGYVISVIRDIPKASMGLLDYLGQPKWSAADWSWQRDTVCLLRTDADRRSFAANESLRGSILVSHFGSQPIEAGELEVRLEGFPGPDTVVHREHKSDLRQPIGTLTRHATLDWTLPAVAEPRRLLLHATLRTPQGTFTNHWPLWLLPALPAPDANRVRLHPSLPGSLARELFPAASPWQPADTNRLVVAARFDDDLVRLLEHGGRVLLLPDGGKHSLPLSDHWFLRGAPCVPDHPLVRRIPRDLFVELQHFDLAGRVIPNLRYLEAVDPLLLLWDTHDLATVKTHGLIFETRAGRGRLLVSAVRHHGPGNAAGRWLLSLLLEHLDSAPAPRHALPDELWRHLQSQLHAEQTNLVDCTWRFRPDPRNEGLTRGWQRTALDSAEGWTDIRIGTAWESQGHAALDGWAWYRLEIEVPARWHDRQIYLSFEGVDDCYELYVNGQLAGKGGDLATRKDAFNERKSHHLTPLVKPGERLVLAVRVHDWFGAGGIFRPVTLGTAPLNPDLEILQAN